MYNKDSTIEAVENNAYHQHARCPRCQYLFSRGTEERIVYCRECGQKLHLRAFSQKEIDDAMFDRMLDRYEDL